MFVQLPGECLSGWDDLFTCSQFNCIIHFGSETGGNFRFFYRQIGDLTRIERILLVPKQIRVEHVCYFDRIG